MTEKSAHPFQRLCQVQTWSQIFPWALAKMGVYNSGGINPAVSAWLPARWSWGGIRPLYPASLCDCVISPLWCQHYGHIPAVSLRSTPPTHSCWAPGWIHPRRLGEVFAIWSAQRLGGKLRRWRRPLAKTDSEGWSVIWYFFVFLFYISILSTNSTFSHLINHISMILTAFP